MNDPNDFLRKYEQFQRDLNEKINRAQQYARQQQNQYQNQYQSQRQTYNNLSPYDIAFKASKDSLRVHIKAMGTYWPQAFRHAEYKTSKFFNIYDPEKRKSLSDNQKIKMLNMLVSEYKLAEQTLMKGKTL